MEQLRFFKVATAPTAGTAEPNAFYMVQNATNPDVADAYVTNNSGVLKQIGNTSMINNLLAENETKLSGGVLDGQEMVLTNNKGGEVRFDVSPLFADISLKSGELNAAGDKLIFTIGDGATTSTVEVPVSALVAVAVGDGLQGNGTPSNPLSLRLSNDAAQTATIGADGGLLVVAADTHVHANLPSLDGISNVGDQLQFQGSAVQRWEVAGW